MKTCQETHDLACDVGRVTVEDWAVAIGDLARVVEDNDLGGEVSHTNSGLVLRVGGNVTPLDVFHRDILYIEADIIARQSLGQGLVVHLHGLDLSLQVDRREGDHHAGLDDPSLHSAHGDCPDAADLVDVLQGQPQRLVSGPGGWDHGVQGLEEGHPAGLALLPLDVPSLVPGHVLRGLDHVVSVPSGDGDERNSDGVVADLLDEVLDLLLDLLKPGLAVGGLGGVHLVAGNDELLDPEGVGEVGVLPGLGDLGLELPSPGGDDEDAAVGLGGPGDHILDEVTMSGRVNDGHIELGSFKLPQSDVDGDAPLALGLQLVEDPGVLEGSLAGLGGLLLVAHDDNVDILLAHVSV